MVERDKKVEKHDNTILNYPLVGSESILNIHRYVSAAESPTSTEGTLQYKPATNNQTRGETAESGVSRP